MAPESGKPAETKDHAPSTRRRSKGRFALIVLVALILVGAIIRSFLPNIVQCYVNRALDQDPRYDSTHIIDGSIHFRVFQSEPPVDIYLSKVNGSIENLGNIENEVTPLNATVKATALAMDHAKVE